MFSQLLDRGCFCDVTLACDGQTLKAHRVVLSACSTYFDSILTNCNSEKDPIIILKDVKFMDIKYLVEFMYKGEINVEHNNLASLLKTAEELRIKGLAEVSWRDDDGENPESNDNNNNNVTETNNSFPLMAQPSNHHQSSALSSSSSASSSSTNQSQMGPSSLQTERKEYDNKENLLKAMPFLAPLSSPKDLSNRKKRGRPPLDESNNFARGPKYVHLINQQYYDDDNNDAKESAYDLSTSASSSSTINPATASHPSSVLSRLIQDDNIAKNHIQDTHERLNGLGSSSKKTHKHSPLPHSFTNSSNLVTVMMDEKNHDSDDHSFYMPLRRDENGHNADYDEESASQKIIPKVERAETPADLTEDDESAMRDSTDNTLQSIFLTQEEREEWKDVIKMNDYLTKGRRPQFWEENYVKRVLDAIKNKNLEMKKAAKLLGVSYGTLYGRYRETYGCLKHPYRGPPGSYMSRMRDIWPGDEPSDLLNLVQRSRMSMLQSDEMNGANLMDMMNDEAMLEHLAPNLAKSFPRKMMNNLDVANLLKQVQSSTNHKIPSPSSSHSLSPPPIPHISTSPNHHIPIPSTSSASSLLVTPVAPSTSIESFSK